MVSGEQGPNDWKATVLEVHVVDTERSSDQLGAYPCLGRLAPPARTQSITI